MIPFAYGRLTGLALHGPARLLLSLFLVVALSACRDPSNEYLYQGTALGTGYHITLYADLGAEQALELEAGIQGELASLERQRSGFLHAMDAAFGWLWLSPAASLNREMDRLVHALAVDRLTLWLDAQRFSPSAMLVEVGGVVRGQGVPPMGGWRLSLEQAGLPDPDGAHRLRLENAALVRRFAQQDGMPLVSLSTLLAVSVVAPSASEAMEQANRLMHARPEEALTLAVAMDSAARVIVKTPQSIEIHHTAALEPWLEP
ncbi:hypothetical protein HOP51_06665 [Halomonas sp. MCCC 1A11036]|uniref:FAD:protein FMN transferase n=1 Tax=Billgrantia zhangzhouensis TaxID=2733481 RepID=A0ABS9ADI8_9GAMM|nr:hypothetical protein [Halomonas zhangzhouensis]MCE8019800.1 hypothetical protein [Halomonas zhangzhouensis]